MKSDVLNWVGNKKYSKLISKETLNHPQLIEMVSGLNVYEDAKEAYLRAYKALGIDIINRVPLENPPCPTPPGTQTKYSAKPNYVLTNLGVYDTASRTIYPCQSPEDVWKLNVESLKYEDLIVPVPHPCTTQDIRSRCVALSEIGLYYPMLYTTLFMWPVEVLGWEVFMLAAMTEPQRFHEHFLLPCVAKSKAIVDEIIAAADSPFVFVHDDLADARGPVFPLSWYNEHIFPHYPEIWAAAKSKGKKVIFVADGNMTAFLPKLIETGVDGIMFENPATPLDAVIEHFGQTGRYFIGGVETTTLTFGSSGEIQDMVHNLGMKCLKYPGFAIASCGGLHGNIPLGNLEAYFDARILIGATPPDWRTKFRKS